MEETQAILNRIMAASGWSQEKMARYLGVSFPTLNSWINGKSSPREKALEKIRLLSVEFLGADSVDSAKLKAVKAEAMRCKYSVRKLVQNRETLRQIGVNFAYHSNATEGSTMSEDDVAAVVLENKVLKNHSRIEQYEAINHQSALYYLLDELSAQGKEFLFTPDLILAAHLRLMNGIMTDAGVYRNHGVRIRGSHVPLANFIKIPELVKRWCDLVNSETMDPIGLMAESHAKFEQIHPFSDGNGRLGRLLLFAMALRFGLVPPVLPKERRAAYYKYLEMAQMREIYDPLELYFAENIIATSKAVAKS